MFSIILNGVALDVNPGQQITLESESNLFTDTLKADGSELISLAPTNRNLKALGHADVIEIEPQSQEYPCLITIGINTYPGKLRIQEVSTSGINCYVLYNMAALNCFSKNCRDFNWDANVIFSDFIDQYALTASNYWPDTPFYFPIIENPAFYDDPDTDPVDKINPHFEGILNKHLVSGGSVVWVDNYVDGISGESINRNTAVPMLPILEVLKRGFLSDGYQIEGSFVKNETVRRLFFYNNQSLDQVVANATDNATAGNSIGYYISFNFEKLNFTTTNNPAVFSVANDEYTVPSTGNYRFQLNFTIGNVVGWVQLSKVYVKLNGTIVQTLTFSGAALVSGTYTFDFTLLFSGGNVGQKLHFEMHALGASGNAGISQIGLQVNRVYADPLYQPADITNLTPHAPDRLFSDVVNALAAAFQLNISVDVAKKIVRLDFKRDALAINQPTDLSGAALLPITQEWQESKDYAMQWANTFYEGIRVPEVLRQIIYRKTGQIDLYPMPLEGFDGQKIAPALSIMEQVNLTDPDLPNSFSLYAKERGRSLGYGLLEQEKDLSIGIYQPDGLWRLASLFGQSITLLISSNQYSISQFHKPWHNYVQKSTRLFKLDVNPLHPQAANLQAGQAIKLMHNTFFIQKLTRTYTATGLQKISLELRKV
jgi:hypothetical protein